MSERALESGEWTECVQCRRYGSFEPGVRLGRLVIVARVKKARSVKWACICDCGRRVEYGQKVLRDRWGCRDCEKRTWGAFPGLEAQMEAEFEDNPIRQEKERPRYRSTKC